MVIFPSSSIWAPGSFFTSSSVLLRKSDISSIVLLVLTSIAPAASGMFHCANKSGLVMTSMLMISSDFMPSSLANVSSLLKRVSPVSTEATLPSRTMITFESFDELILKPFSPFSKGVTSKVCLFAFLVVTSMAPVAPGMFHCANDSDFFITSICAISSGAIPMCWARSSFVQSVGLAS